MNNLKIIKGNIFTSKYQTIVNTVNCVGIMGAGIALECKLRYPEMYSQYVDLCNQKLIDIGKLWIYKSTNRWILNFPTKKHWKYPTKEEYLHSGLQKFTSTYRDKGVTSIAFPVLGGSNGGLEQSLSLEIMKSYLSTCDIPIEIYLYDPQAHDDLYEQFKAKFSSMPIDELVNVTGLKSNYIFKLREALTNPSIYQLNQLTNIKGIGEVTLEKAFRFMHEDIKKTQNIQSGFNF